jgi:beta-carotene 15,15'-dioxygenase
MSVPVVAHADMYMLRPIGALSPPRLRLWALPIFTLAIILLDMAANLGAPHVTMIAAIAIVLAGIPHGTLDAEIAATRFGLSGTFQKIAIIAGYVFCALAMLIVWQYVSELALIIFLVISVVHFSADWRGGADSFFALMAGWALISLPALSHPAAVAEIFEMLTANKKGETIAALLACSSVPATLGCAVFAYWTFKNEDAQTALDVMSCLIAALLLPPLVAFAIFFCGLHSPRHMLDALRETGGITRAKKLLVIGFVTALSIGIGVLIFIRSDNMQIDAAVIRTGFVLLSTLTVPHFILEYLLARQVK